MTFLQTYVYYSCLAFGEYIVQQKSSVIHGGVDESVVVWVLGSELCFQENWGELFDYL